MSGFMLEFFGLTFRVLGAIDMAELRFLFGPHVIQDVGYAEEALLDLHLLLGDGRSRELRVLRRDGTLVRRGQFRALSGLSPLLPPLRVMDDRFVMLQAVVVAKGAATVALIGGLHSPRAEVAMALCARGWRLVSGQLLVLDRDTGEVRPLLEPVDLRGDALESARAGGLLAGRDGTEGSGWKTVSSPLSGDAVLIRPELLGRTVPVGARLGGLHLVRLCRSDSGRSRLDAQEFTPRAWPPEAASVLDAAPRLRLLLPQTGGAEEAADLVDADLFSRTAQAELFPSTAQEEVPCRGALPTARGPLAGSTTSPSTRRARASSTDLSSDGSLWSRIPVATT
ncbi:hypothetical protein ACGFYQ_18495 [Streptomyces sp. NPDC048258]|uniref:hypothetical protein n=1 Tax=Streptomyces sp. NPDC048258 TaxID=3365527 RepID=UPI00370F9E5B